MLQRHTFRTGDLVRDPETSEEYRILDLIGVGAYAEVFKAECVRTRTLYALKVLNIRRAAEPKTRERHRREGNLLRRVRNPNLVQVHALIEDGGLVVMVMDLLVGRTLGQLRADCGGKLPINTALELMTQVCEALAAIHSQNVVHRDIKPENIFVGEDGHVRLCDLGASQFPHEQRITTDGIAIGTVAYMSPEQLYSPELVGPRSDLFAVGAVLYEILAGVNPFAVNGVLTENIKELGLKIILQPHMPLKVAAPHVPDDVADIIESLLAKDPAARPASAAHLFHMLDSAHAMYLDDLAQRNEAPVRISFVNRLPPVPRVATEEMPLPPASPNPFVSVSTPPPEPVATARTLLALAKTDPVPVVQAPGGERQASLPPAPITEELDVPLLPRPTATAEIDAAARASLELANRETTPWLRRAPPSDARTDATSAPAVTLPARSPRLDSGAPDHDASLTTESRAALEVVGRTERHRGSTPVEPVAGRSLGRRGRRSRWVAASIVALFAGTVVIVGRAALVLDRLGPAATPTERPPASEPPPRPATTAEGATEPRPPIAAPTAPVNGSPSGTAPTVTPPAPTPSAPGPRAPDPGRRQPASDARPTAHSETPASTPNPSKPGAATPAASNRLFGVDP